MDFFQHQERARTRTTLLVVYFVLAVAAIILSVYLVVALFFVRAEHGGLWNPETFLGVAACVTLVVVAGSWYKIMTLAGGGRVVAEMFGGRLVPQDTRDFLERRLLNVVDEMAIAAGMPAPPVYIVDSERGINAFAAGYAPSDAVVAVTRGTLELLSRDELQGVVAHEFSHILHGDMRINIRLMGVLHGILLISLIGYFILRATTPMRLGARSDSRRGSPLPLFGLALYILGYVGVFFGKLIKSAISRQREFLADASAVQYTRNPPGIAGALLKIGGVPQGSKINSEHAEEASHMFFGNAVGVALLNLMATHPPLGERIRRIDASFDGRFPRFDPADLRSISLDEAQRLAAGDTVSRFAGEPAFGAHEPTQAALEARRPGARQADSPGAAGRGETIGARDRASPPATLPRDVVDQVGRLDQQAIEYATQVLASLPRALAAAAREPAGASALACLLLLDRDDRIRALQMDVLAERSAPEVRTRLNELLAASQSVAPRERLPLLELALPTLRTMSPAQLERLRSCIRGLIEADKKMSLFEYVLERSLEKHLRRNGVRPPVEPTVRHTPDALFDAAAVLLSAVAYASRSPQPTAEKAFNLAMHELTGEQRSYRIVPVDRVALRYVDQALSVLENAPPHVKKRLLTACGTCIAADERLTVEEVELVRLVADVLDCPIPPMAASG